MLKYIIELQKEGKLTLTFSSESIPVYLDLYLFSINSIGFWIIIVLSVATAISVYMIPEKAYPYVYLRYVLGSIFVLFLPGYSLVKALFPTR